MDYIKNVPVLPKKTLTDQITIKVRPEMKQLWAHLRATHGYDLHEMTRMFWEETLHQLAEKDRAQSA